MPRSSRHRVFKRFKYAIIPLFDEFGSQNKSTTADLMPLYDFFLSRFRRLQQELEPHFDSLPTNCCDLAISPPIVFRIPNIGRLTASLPSSISCFQVAMLRLSTLLSDHLSRLCIPLILLLSIASSSSGSTLPGPSLCQSAEDKIYAGRLTPVSATSESTYRSKFESTTTDQDTQALLTSHTLQLLVATTLLNIRLVPSKLTLRSKPILLFSGRIFPSRSLQTSAPGPHLVYFSLRLYACHPPASYFLAPGREGIG